MIKKQKNQDTYQEIVMNKISGDKGIVLSHRGIDLDGSPAVVVQVLSDKLPPRIVMWRMEDIIPVQSP